MNEQRERWVSWGYFTELPEFWPLRLWSLVFYAAAVAGLLDIFARLLRWSIT